MMLSLMSLVVASAITSQAPDEAAWLKAVPADVDFVAHVRPLEKSRNDLVAMVKAMSPTFGPTAEPLVNMGLEQFSTMFGKGALTHPFVLVGKLPPPGETAPTWGVLVQSDDYTAVLKSVSQKDDAKPKSLGGYDSFENSQGQTYFSWKGPGFVAFGPDEALIKAMVKPSGSLDAKLTTEVKTALFAGDVGLYVNVVSIQKTYGSQIDAIKGQVMAAMDQAGGQANAQMMDSMKSLYGMIFDGIKTGEALAIHLDFSASDLTLGGVATSKPDSTKPKTSPKLGTGEILGKMPNDAMSYVYLSMDPTTSGFLQKIGMSFMTGASKPSPELDAALAQQAKIAGDEAYTATTTGASGTKSVSVTFPTDPKKAVELGTAVFKTMASPEGFVKDAIVDPSAETYNGFVFNRVKMTYNFEKMAPPNLPGGPETLKKMLGGDFGYAWYGTNGKMVLSVSAKNWDEAKAQIDSVVSGTNSLSKVAGYQTLRDKLPKNATALMLISSQGLVRQMASQIGMMTGGDMKIPTDMPKEVALMGLGVVANPQGFGFSFVLPSNNGPVFEKGLLPLFQAMQGGVQQ